MRSEYVDSQRSRSTALWNWFSQHRSQLIILALLISLYAVFYIPLSKLLGYSASALSILPVALAGWFFGLPGGMLVYCLALALNIILTRLSGASPLALFLSQGEMTSVVAVFLVGVFAGLLAVMAQRTRESEAARARLVGILETTTDLVATARPDGRLLYLNQAGHSMLGLKESEDLSQTNLSQIMSPESQHSLFEEAIPTALQRGSWSGETLWLSRSGACIPASQVVIAHQSEAGELEYLSLVARDISQSKQAEEAQLEQRVLSDALRDTAAALNSTLHFEEVLDRILENVGRVMPHDVAHIMLIEGDVARIVRRRSNGTQSGSPWVVPDHIVISTTPTLRQLVESGRPLIVPDTQVYPDWVHFPEALWVRSHIGAPIQVKGKVIGLLNLESATPDFYHAEHAVRLQAFADQAAMALENARLLAEAEQRAAQFEAQYGLAHELAAQQDLPARLSTLVERSVALLHAAGGGVFLYDPQRAQLTLEAVLGLDLPLGSRLSIDQGMAGQIARTRQPLVLRDYQHWEHHLEMTQVLPVASTIAVPMLYSGELVGVLCVFEAGDLREFSEPEVRLLTLFAGHAASAVHNSRLFDETRRRLKEMETINEMSSSLRTLDTIDEILPVLLDEALKALQTDAGIIWLYDAESDCLYPSTARGWFANLPPTRLKSTEGIAGAAFSSGQSLSTEELAEDPRLSLALKQWIPGGWSAGCLPIRSSQATVGVLIVAVALPRKVTVEEIDLLRTLAEMAGSAFHRVSLFEQSQKHLQRLAALHTIDITISASLEAAIVFDILLDQVLAQLVVDAAGILTLDPHTRVLEYAAGRGFLTSAYRTSRVPLSQDLASQTILEQRKVFIANLQENGEQFARLGLVSSEKFVAYCGVPLIVKGQVKGVLEIFHRSPLRLDDTWLDFLETLAGQAAIASENASLLNDLQRSNLELTMAYDATIEGWSRALDLRDEETEGHTQRVTEMTMRLGEAIGLSEAELVQARRGALLHDIGKMGISDAILHKPGPLTAREQIIMQRHPSYAYELLSPIRFLRPALDIPYYHHEKWDGTGYPQGLKGEQIPLPARIFAVVDVWDALTSNRPYRQGWSYAQARAYIQEQAGKYFDPNVVKAFLDCFVEYSLSDQNLH